MSVSTPYNADEKELLLRLQEGDHEAFGKLYNFYCDRIYGRLARLSGSESMAAELLQETFVILWEKRYTINPELSFKSWLYRVAENNVYQYYRKLARDAKMQQHVMAHFSELYSHSEEDLILKESRQILQEAISKLPEQRRRVFQLCKIEGRSYNEAARILGISPSTVSNHLVKANAIVKTYIFKSQQTATIILAAFFLNR